MIARKSIFAQLLLGVLVILSARPAGAQAIWSLTLDAPDQTVIEGTAGTPVFTGAIQNTDASQILTLFGDAFTTGVWDGSLTLSEDPLFVTFLNGGGTIDHGNSYTGALFDLTYTAATPPATSPPYDAGFRVDTDGSPNSLLADLTLTVKPRGSVPEPGATAFVTALAGGGLGLISKRARKRPCGSSPCR